MPREKIKFALRISPETQRLVKEMCPRDNCRTQDEFIEKALRFYAGYISGQDAAAHLGNYVRYVATREGVELPAARPENYVGYIARRPRSHGLFSGAENVPPLSQIAKEVAEHPGSVWLPILSLRREDLPDRPPLSRRKEFRRIKNLVVEAAVRLGEQETCFPGQEKSASGRASMLSTSHPQRGRRPCSTAPSGSSAVWGTSSGSRSLHPPAGAASWTASSVGKSRRRKSPWAISRMTMPP